MNKFVKILLGIIYWILQLTWGIITTLAGLIIVSILWFADKESTIHKNGYTIIMETGGNWGGLELGAFALMGHYYPGEWYEHTRRHEFGHSIQNIIFGPFTIFIVMIPSAIRYWYRRLTPGKTHPDYDSFWVEGSATRWGTFWIDKIESGK